MTAFFADLALLPGGWAQNVRLEVDAGGALAAVSPDASDAGAMRLAGPVMPGLCDLHCHAFQRAMAGLTERRSATTDSFWTWRDVMYKFAAQLTPDDLEAVATQLYIELLKGGYTAVCEFHYVHNDPGGRPYANRVEMSERLLRAARRAGIGITVLPVLYRTANFGGVPPHEGQRRFVTTVDQCLEIVRALRGRGAGDPNVRIGHRSALAARRPARGAARRDPRPRRDRRHRADPPPHRRADEGGGRLPRLERPAAGRVAAREPRGVVALVPRPRHASQRPRRSSALARSGAVAGLCPTTEANLGDGFFPLPAFLAQGGVFGIGSDSNVSTSSVEELRWLEYGQRLLHRRRSIAASPADAVAGARALPGSGRRRRAGIGPPDRRPRARTSERTSW